MLSKISENNQLSVNYTYRKRLLFTKFIYKTNITFSTNISIDTNQMSNNKFDALGSDDSEGDDTLNNHQQLEVIKNSNVINLIDFIKKFYYR